ARGRGRRRRAVGGGRWSAKRTGGRAEVVGGRLEVVERRRGQVEVDVVEGAGAGGGAEVDLAAGVGLAAEHAGREVEEARERGATQARAVAGGRAAVGQRGECRPRRGGEGPRQR